MDATAEELLVLRLPPRLAARIGARIDKYDRSRGDAGTLLRRRRRKGRDDKDSARQTQALIQAIWGDDGILDYDNLSKAEDLLFLDGMQDEDGEAEDDDNAQKEENETEAEDVNDSGDREVEYWRVEGRNYIFKYGEDEYYATLVNLPCIVEAQKSTDNTNVYKTGDVGQMLIVHDVKLTSGQPRPEIDPSDLYEGVYAHGLTPPMKRIAPDRFAKVSSAARRAEHSLSMDDVRRADDMLFEFKELVLQKNRKGDSGGAGRGRRPGVQPGQASGLSSTIFMHEEIINAEPWMEYADDVIVIEKGDDNFKSSTKKARNKAWDNKSMQDEKRKQGNRPSQSTTSTTTTAAAPPSTYDPVASFRGGSIGWAPPVLGTSLSPVSLSAPPSIPPVSLLAPPMARPLQDTSQPGSRQLSPGEQPVSPGAIDGDFSFDDPPPEPSHQ